MQTLTINTMDRVALAEVTHSPVLSHSTLKVLWEVLAHLQQTQAHKVSTLALVEFKAAQECLDRKLTIFPAVITLTLLTVKDSQPTTDNWLVQDQILSITPSKLRDFLIEKEEFLIKFR